MHIALIVIDRGLKVGVVPIFALVFFKFEAILLISQALVLLCYALLSGGKDALFAKRIISNTEYLHVAIRYRLRTLLLLTPIILSYFYSLNIESWIEYCLICLIALFGGCFDVWEIKFQAIGNHESYLCKKILTTIIFFAIACGLSHVFLIVAPYVYSIFYNFNNNLNIKKIFNIYEIKKIHFSAYFYGLLLNLAAAKYELILGLVDDVSRDKIANLALMNRFADLISFGFTVLVIRNLKLIQTGQLYVKRNIDKLLTLMFILSAISILIIFLTIKEELYVVQQILIGGTLGICYGAGGIMSHVWAALNLPKTTLKIGITNIGVLLFISLPLYFLFGFNAFVLSLTVTQIILTFLPYLKYRKLWLL